MKATKMSPDSKLHRELSLALGSAAKDSIKITKSYTRPRRKDGLNHISGTKRWHIILTLAAKKTKESHKMSIQRDS